MSLFSLDYSTGPVHDLNYYSFDDWPILDYSSLTKVVIWYNCLIWFIFHFLAWAASVEYGESQCWTIHILD